MRRVPVICALAVVAALALSACGDDGGGEIVLPRPEGTVTFLREDADVLIELLTVDANEHGWAAGCFWPNGTLSSDRLYVADLLAVPRASAAEASWEVVDGWRYASVYRTDYEGPPQVGFAKVESDVYLCYEPGDPPGIVPRPGELEPTAAP